MGMQMQGQGLCKPQSKCLFNAAPEAPLLLVFNLGSGAKTQVYSSKKTIYSSHFCGIYSIVGMADKKKKS